MKLTSKRTPLWLACILLVTIAAGTAAGTPKQSSGFRIGILPQLTLFQAGFQTERRSNLMMYIAPRIIQDDESRAPHEPMFADNDASPVETLERWASSTANSAVAGKLATATREPAFWGELYAGRQKYQTRSSRSGLESCTTGVMMGVHYPIGADLLVGLMLGYERNNFDISHSGGHGDMDSLRFGPYASKRFGPWVVDASVTVGFHWTDYTRTVNPSASAHARYQSCDITGSLTVGRDFQVCPDTIVTPYATLMYTYMNQEGFKESGAMHDILAYKSIQETALTTYLGARCRRKTALFGQAVLLTGNLALARQCFFGDESVSASYVHPNGFGLGSSQSVGRGSRYFVTYGLGVEMPISTTSNLSLNYSGRTGSDHCAQMLSLMYRVAL